MDRRHKGVAVGKPRRIPNEQRQTALHPRGGVPRRQQKRPVHVEPPAGRLLETSSVAIGEGGRASPELYRRKINGEIAEAESQTLALGRAAHCLIQEGRTAFDERYLVADGPVNPKVVHRIVTDDVPPTLTTMRLREGIPYEWGEQERVLLGE